MNSSEFADATARPGSPSSRARRLAILLFASSFGVACAAAENPTGSSDSKERSEEEEDQDDEDAEQDDDRGASRDQDEGSDEEEEPSTRRDAGASDEEPEAPALPRGDAGAGITIPPNILLPDGGINIDAIRGLGGDAGFGGLGGLGGLGGFGGLGGLGGDTTPAEPLDPSVKQPDASKLPKVNGACPEMRSATVTVAGARVRLWVGSKKGPVFFYWHGTGGSATEVNQGIPGATGGVAANGGLVASFETTNGQGTTTGNAVWYTGDFDAADQILACAIEAGIADTGRIHTSGYSAGGLQVGAMVVSRSNYIASAIAYSGGTSPLGGNQWGDRSNVPAVIVAHGAMGSDWLVLDFAQASAQLASNLSKMGGFVVDCDDGGGHVALNRLGIGGRAMAFFSAHPYNTKPSPWESGLPSGWPSYCKIIE